MFRKPIFWLVFVVVSLVCVWFAAANFPRAFPLVQLDLEMSRQEALTAARALAERHGWGPADYRQTANFDLDSQLQSFVELEGGGKDAFAAMLTGELVSPYIWEVRHFQEYETNETRIRFTPAGDPYGFFERMPEDAPGAALETQDARRIAEGAATADWAVDFAQFELVEESHEVRPSDRVDHTFVYQRPAATVGEDGRYRMRLTVSGDRFTELTHFVKIPEAFSRRYEEMRSANNGIAIGASIAMALLYLVGGTAIGLFLLLRGRWVVWKPPIKWAVAIACVWLVLALNQWPMSWMGYDTAVSVSTFTIQQLVLALVQAVAMGVLFAVTVMAAESLTRKAFPHHVQLWRSWAPEVAGTRRIAGYTVAGLLLVAAFLAYEVFLYALANERLGWWTPSSPLFDPNIVATYFPWLTSIAISLWAGFWEESVFRAIPIASAALLGRRFGGQKWWIIGALFLQAVIFGAGHANYPQQPSYARVVEIFLPAVGFGLIYLALGLLPAIVLHFAVDVVFISMPVFASEAPGIWLDRAMVVVLALVPLWVVLRGRWKSGRWGEVAIEDTNGAWQPPSAPVVEPVAEPEPVTVGIGKSLRSAVLIAGVLAILGWLVVSDFSSDAPPFEVGRSEVVAASQRAFEERTIEVPPTWRELTTVTASADIAHRFVWQEGGEEAYSDLLGSYLEEPAWFVRRALFEGDVAERAEEYGLWFGGDGQLLRFRHQLPQQRPGAELTEADARTTAREAIQSVHGLDPGSLEEVSADAEQHDERRDWRFVYSDPGASELSEGDTRIAVHIAGDVIVDSYRFVHVPESWERSERDRRTLAQVVQIVCTVTMVLVFLAGAIFAIVRWSRGQFSVASFVISFVVLFGLGVVEVLNSWPAMTANFSTAQPYSLQSSIVLVGSLLAMLVISVAVGLAVGVVPRWAPARPDEGTGRSLMLGASLGAIVACVAAIAGSIGTPLEPDWGPYQAAAAMVPALAAALGPISSWITTSALVLLVLAFVHATSRGWTRLRYVIGLALVVFGLMMAGVGGVETLPRWLGSGVGVGMLMVVCYVLILRHNVALVPVVTAVVAILGTLREGMLRLYPGSLAGSAVAAILIALAAAYWLQRFTRESETETDAR
jgi:hypothetical protein